MGSGRNMGGRSEQVRSSPWTELDGGRGEARDESGWCPLKGEEQLLPVSLAGREANLSRTSALYRPCLPFFPPFPQLPQPLRHEFKLSVNSHGNPIGKERVLNSSSSLALFGIRLLKAAEWDAWLKFTFILGVNRIIRNKQTSLN